MPGLESRSFILPLAVSLTVVVCPVLTFAAEDSGLEVPTMAWDADRGFGDFSAHITLTTTKKNGKKVIRRLRTRTVETDDGDKSISVFDYPNDVKGFARLTYAHEDGNDDQWLYIPEFKRVKRISSVNAGTPFMGTEYAFEDLGSQRPEEIGSFSYKELGEERCGEGQTLNCHVIERRPNNPYSAYSKQIVWIDDMGYRVQKIDYYNKDDDLFKTQILKDYRQFLGKHWRPGIMLMTNHKNGNNTLVEWSQYQFNNGFNTADFTPGKLKNAR
jgi:outer membrane lipoprotein-sorting protein